MDQGREETIIVEKHRTPMQRKTEKLSKKMWGRVITEAMGREYGEALSLVKTTST